MPIVMVVDDSATARRFIVGCLEPQGHVIREVEPTCLYEVLSALHAEVPDLLVTDLVMPGCPGQTLIRACREDSHLKQMKILLLTGHGDIALAHFLQNMGSTHYLTKPVAPPELADCVARLLSGDLAVDPGWSLACNGVVAVIDDSQLSRVYHSACLRKGGFRPVEITPTDLLGTLEAVSQARPDLILLDYLMPKFRGDALVRVLRSRQSDPLQDVPILMVTAHDNEDLSARIKDRPHVEILSKPLYPEQLLDRVEALLERHRTA